MILTAKRHLRLTPASLNALATLAFAPSTQARENAVYRFSPVNWYAIELAAGDWNRIVACIAARSGLKP